MNERRLARVAISHELLIEMMTQDNFVSAVQTTKGIPKDSVFVHSYTDDASAQTYFVFEHPSFDVVEMGCVIPTLRIEHTRSFGRSAAAMMVLEGLPE
jgi:hypothetical protein